MEPLHLLIIYRIVIVLVGFACIYWGYRLFFAVTKRQSEFKLKYKEELDVGMRDISPGIFFALFGAGILIFSLVNPIEINMQYQSGHGSPIIYSGQGAAIGANIHGNGNTVIKEKSGKNRQ